MEAARHAAEAQEATMIETRTYESFDIVWDRGSRWTNYDTAADAQAVIDGSPSDGTVERKTFSVEVTPERAHLYKPGLLSERHDLPEEVAR